MNHKSSLKIGVGTPTILMIFVVLCMVIISVLSYQEATYRQTLANKEKDAVVAYYKADVQAQRIAKALRPSKLHDIQEKYNVKIIEQEQCYCYDIEIDEKRVLSVEISKTTYQPQSWVVKSKES